MFFVTVLFLQINANITCQLGLNDYSGKPSNKHVLNHRSSKVDVFANKENASGISTEPALSAEATAVSQTNNKELDHNDDVDNFDHILQVTSHQEAVYAYYYMDENNKVCLFNAQLYIYVNNIFLVFFI